MKIFFAKIVNSTGLYYLRAMLPPLLKKGSVVAIVAPARKIEEEKILPAVKLLESWGLIVVLGVHLFGSHHQFSGTDEARLADFNAALEDPEIQAVFCARGGYGCTRIVDGINLHAIRNFPKWIVGYSDITAILAHVYRYTGVVSIHGTMPINFPSNGREDVAVLSLKELLFNGTFRTESPAHELNRNGVARGKLIGGNLSILYNLHGSASDLDTGGAILLLEDLDEYLYHVDRMMVALKRNGKLDWIKGLIVGGMTAMKDNAIPFGASAEELIYSHVKQFEFPVAMGYPSGHIDQNLSWYFGGEVSLEVTNKGSFLESI